ncbi:Hypothetical protein SRAE_1000291400 [Strongyloides ratti]|uniref:Uncharacterized protein n=1 Tax=Strongyloides ratti TaxID=34506 RepID=A0A090L4E2_STRRB|nr:Hypothetical protein SRAE_1000291400 [Strongyloides ratti]CEF64661.1 Hypothetical protein SRAE_1000291400 [Strongyloides ratti]
MVWSYIAYSFTTLKRKKGYDKERHLWTNEEFYLQLDTFFIPTITFLIQVIIRQIPFSSLIKEYWRFLRLQSARKTFENINIEKVEKILEEIKAKEEIKVEEIKSETLTIVKSFATIKNEGNDLLGNDQKGPKVKEGLKECIEPTSVELQSTNLEMDTSITLKIFNKCRNFLTNFIS